MFNENLKRLRQQKGFTQNELALQVNVVRQTISKWEKGLSVPDADVLQKLAQVLDVEVSQLLGAEIVEEDNQNEVAEQLARINEQLVVKNRRASRIWKTIGIIFLVILALNLLLAIVGMVGYSEYSVESGSKEIRVEDFEEGKMMEME